MKAFEFDSKATDSKEQEHYNLLDICDALEFQKCVLILGDYTFSKPSEEAPEGEEYLREMLLRKQMQLAPDNNNAGTNDILSIAATCLSRGGLKQPWLRTHMELNLEDLGSKQKERFKKISEIKFDLILSTYPHDLLPQVFADNQIAHDFSYYNYSGDPEDELEEPSPERPLIYNLFGSGRKNKQSIVNTTERLYGFFNGVLGARRIPPLIEDKISQATHLIFLGFSFDDWYMKILLWLFRGSDKKESVVFAHSLSSRGLKHKEKLFFEDNFKVTFLDKQVDEFISALYLTCKKQDLVRSSHDKNEYDRYKELEALVIEYQLKKVFEELNDILLNEHYKKDQKKELIIKLNEYERRYQEIEEGDSYETYTKEEWKEKQDKLKEELISLIQELGKN